MSAQIQLREYEEALLRFVESNKPTKQEIDEEFENVLDEEDVDNILDALGTDGGRKYIQLSESLDFEADFGDGKPIKSISKRYELTPLGKNYLANTTSNFTSFNNITNSNIANYSHSFSQSLKISELPPDLRQLFEEFEAGIKTKDAKAITKALTYIGDKSVDVLIAVLAGQIVK